LKLQPKLNQAAKNDKISQPSKGGKPDPVAETGVSKANNKTDKDKNVTKSEIRQKSKIIPKIDKDN
jgi:hypothetical protein